MQRMLFKAASGETTAKPLLFACVAWSFARRAQTGFPDFTSGRERSLLLDPEDELCLTFSAFQYLVGEIRFHARQPTLT